MLKHCVSILFIYSMLKYRGSLWGSSCCQPLLTPWLKSMYVCVCMPRTMFAHCARARTLARLAAVKLLLLLLLLLLVVVVCCSVTLGANANITDVTQKRLCRDILGEDVGRVVNGVDLDNPHEVMCDQLLYKQVFELDVLGLL